ncbi:MAG: hypothetical protein LBT33_08165 [Spirochaetia bacterium]|jgi:hypothetical protein|nr:hypothetical protein [Spirochaetia bacterium]
MGYFDGASSGSPEAPQVEALAKALAAGYGTDAATFINGRALIPENLESTVVNVVAALKEDCKLLNSMKTVPVKSTVHEVNRRTSHGDYRFLSTPEGGPSRETDQAIERVPFMQKYIQTKRRVTRQMELVDSFEDAYTSEKLSGVEVVCKAAEYNLFHGDSSVVPTDFDGFIPAIKKSASPNIEDLRGASVGSKGEGFFDDMAARVWERGGDLSRVLFPSKLARDIKDLFTDRLRMMVKDQKATFDQLPDYPTAIGSTLRFTGEGAGADKFFHVRGPVAACGDPEKRPNPVSSVAVAALTSQAGSMFAAADAGDYRYTVFAENHSGISTGVSPGGAGTVAAGGGLQLTITPDKSKPVTGLIVCRSAKGGTDVMEMVQIPVGAGATTVFVDLNKDLPGTASMLFLTQERIQPVYKLGQLLPVSTYPLYPVNAAETPFLVMFYGALELRAPEFCAIAENISYPGGLY